MSNLIYSVKKQLKSSKSLKSGIEPYSKIYLHAIENISGSFGQLDFNNKNVLTVAGSGDYMLNSYLMGAKNVTCFDNNPLAFVQVKLKRAAVCALNYQEYVNFFFSKNNWSNEKYSPLDWRLFDKLRSYLDEDTIIFFDYMYSNYSPWQILYALYYQFPIDYNNSKRINPYLDETNFEKLSSILKDKNIKFIKTNLPNLNNKITDNSYDIMLFSIIINYIDRIYNDSKSNLERLERYKNFINSLNSYLNKPSTIQLGYIYNAEQKNGNLSVPTYDDLKKVFNDSTFQINLIDSFKKFYDHDAIVTYTYK